MKSFRKYPLLFTQPAYTQEKEKVLQLGASRFLSSQLHIFELIDMLKDVFMGITAYSINPFLKSFELFKTSPASFTKFISG